MFVEAVLAVVFYLWPIITKVHDLRWAARWKLSVWCLMVTPPLIRSSLVFAGWLILPDSITSIVYICFVRLRLKLSPDYRPPAKGTAQAAILYRYCYAFTMMAYLLITTIHSFITMPTNFYDVLGVNPTVDEQALKVAFRHFARRHHPDRVGPSGEPFFIAVRDAYEFLRDPLKRLAYDRFGPDAMTWKGCATHREYIKHGLLASSGYYIGTTGGLVLWSIFGAKETGAYWQNLLFCTLFLTELSLILNTSSDIFDFLQDFLPSPWFRKRVSYQYILFLHQLYMNLSIAIPRVIPKLLPAAADTFAETLAMTKPLIDKLALLAMTTDQEVSRLLSLELDSMHGSSAVSNFAADSFALPPTPFVPSEETMQALICEMENLIIDKEIRANPVLQNQWQAVIDRLRREAKPISSSTDEGTPPSATSNGSPFPPGQLRKEEGREITFDQTAVGSNEWPDSQSPQANQELDNVMPSV